MRKKKKSKRIVTVNFAGAESSRTIPEEDYEVEVESIEEEEGKKGTYFAWELEVSKGKYKGRKLYHNTSLAPQSLWNLRATLEALGMEVPDSAMDIALDELIGLKMGVTVEHEKYKGKDKNRVIDVFNLEEEEEDEDEEEEEEGEEKEEKEEEEEEEEEVDIDDLSLEELVEYAEENDIKLSKRNRKTKKRAKEAIAEALK